MNRQHETACHVLNANAPGSLILLAEHAGRAIPAEYGTLGLEPRLLDEDLNLAGDYSVDAIARCLADRLGATAVLGHYSRLLVDLNRVLSDDLVPACAHGMTVPGNIGIDETEAMKRRQIYYNPFHDAVARQIDRRLAAGLRPVLFTVHSFSPMIGMRQAGAESAKAPDLGLLFFETLPACPAIDRLRSEATARGLTVQDNFPYDLDKVPAGGIHRHGLARDLPCAGVEISIERLQTAAERHLWCDLLAAALKQPANPA